MAATTSCPHEHRLDAFLARTLRADELLEIEAHFDACDDCRRLVFALARSEDASSPAAGPVRDARHIGRYEIASPLGEGAMGVVFAARDPALQRDVALKLLRATGSQLDAANRLRREARGLARLDHPNVVAIYDVGTHGDDVYLAMELIRGVSLERWLALRPRRIPEIVDVLLQAAHGLAAAHRAGLVHRDIKPSNVMVTVDERVKVVDFGLAQAASRAAARDTARADDLAARVTATGAFVGTPAYSAPEVLAGEPADRRSDVFSFCVMAFEALYGRRPFAATTLDELRRELGRPVELPRTPRVPHAIRRMLIRGLAPERGARPASIEQLVPALRAAQWPRRRIAAGALAAITLVAGAAVLATRGGDDAQLAAACDAAATPPVLAYDPAAIERAFETALPGGAGTARRVIARLDAWRTEAGALAGKACRASRIEGTESSELFRMRVDCIARSTDRVTALVRQLPEPTPALVDDAIAVTARATDLSTCASRRDLLAPGWISDPAQRSLAFELHAKLAAVSVTDALGRHEDASRDARAIAEQAQRAKLRDVELTAWSLVGQAHSNAQEPVAARDAYQRALVAAEAMGDSTKRAYLYTLLVTVDQHLDRPQDAAQWAAQARSLADHLDDPELRWHVKWAEAAVATNTDPKRAVALLEETIALRGPRPDDDVTSIELVRALGAAQIAAGDLAAGKRTLERALAEGERVLGASHPALIDTLTALGVASAGFAPLAPADALPYLERAFRIAEAAAGRDHARLPRTAYVLAGVYGELMRVRDAVTVLDRTVVAFEAAYGKETPTFADVLEMRAEMLVLDGFDSGNPAHLKAQVERALADKLRALAIKRVKLSPDAPELAVALERLGRVQRFADLPKDAIRSFEEALAIRARDPATRPALLFEPTVGLGGALVDAGRARDGLPHLEKALAIAEDQGLFGSDEDVALAQAELGAALVALRRDRKRARALLLAARATLAHEPSDVAEIDALLRKLD